MFDHHSDGKADGYDTSVITKVFETLKPSF